MLTNSNNHMRFVLRRNFVENKTGKKQQKQKQKQKQISADGYPVVRVREESRSKERAHNVHCVYVEPCASVCVCFVCALTEWKEEAQSV